MVGKIFSLWLRLRFFKPFFVIFMVFFILFMSNLPILKFSDSLQKNSSDQMVQIHNNFPAVPMYEPIDGIFEIYMYDYDSNSEIIYGNCTYKGNDWVGHINLKNTTINNNNKLVTTKVYRTINDTISVKELWLNKKIEFPINKNLVLFRRSPGINKLTFTFKNRSQLYIDMIIKNYFKDTFSVKPVIYLCRKKLRYNELVDPTFDDEITKLTPYERTIGPHGYEHFPIGPVNIQGKNKTYISIVWLRNDSNGDFEPYEHIDWTEIEKLKEPIEIQVRKQMGALFSFFSP